MNELDLISQIAVLEARIDALKAENARLRAMLRGPGANARPPAPGSNISGPNTASGISDNTNAQSSNVNGVYAVPKQPPINTGSQADAKIELYMSLFRGRPNVYAKRCFFKKDNKMSYMPTCGNYRKSGCGRPKIKCGACKNGKPLTPYVVRGHMENIRDDGDGIIGVYPLLEDDTCYFLAVDFDGKSWKDDIAAYRDICKRHGVPVGVERSRSGNGGHVWIFFNEPVPAVQARKMGSMLLTEATAMRHEIAFKAYDRMFPNQDLLPKGGLGNLIALPFQGGPSRNGNSLFINEEFIAYDDQWAYLAGIRRMAAGEVNKIANACLHTGETGELANSSFDEDEASKPWQKKRVQAPLKPSDIFGGGDIAVVQANMLYLRKDCASQRALNRIKRLAAFSNPEFYMRQRMRRSVRGTPRIIYSIDETPEYLGIPRGCKEPLLELLEPAGRTVVFDDQRNHGRQINVRFTGELHEDQIPAVDALSRQDMGVLCAATSFGKTVIGAAVIAIRQCNTLVLVNKLALLEQWKQKLGQFLEINEDLPKIPHGRGRKKQYYLIGQIGGGKDSPSGIIDVATVQSLYSDNDVKDIVKDYGMVIIDECHHIPADTFEFVLRAANARYIYGLTATPQRKDGKHPLMYMQCGPALYTVDAKIQAAKRGFEHYVIPCFTSFKKPLSQTEAEWGYKQIEADITVDEPRNRQIAADVLNAVNDGRNPIVLTQRKDHIPTLAALINNQCGANVIELDGGATAKQKLITLNAISSIPEDEQLVIIATGKYVGEGFDCPRLDTLFLAMPVSWKGILSQYAGRLHRSYPGKNDVVIYDYIDVHVALLERMYHKRVAAYGAIGYKILAKRNQTEQSNVIFDSKSFEPVLRGDIDQAKTSVLIVSPFALIRRTQTILVWLAPILKNADVKVTVAIRALDDFKEKERAGILSCINIIRSANINVIHKSSIHQKFIVIDDRLVWYGSINLLSYGKQSEESIMRFESREIAYELSRLVIVAND